MPKPYYKHNCRMGIGPGGMRCPCCNPYRSGGSSKTTKQYLNRRWRRQDKQWRQTHGEE